MGNELQPVLVDEATGKALQSLLRRRYRGSGGIEVKMMPNGDVSICFRGLQQQQMGGADNQVIVKITSIAVGGNKFNARICTGANTAVAMGTLAMPEGLTVPANDNALVLNMNGDGIAAHMNLTGTYWNGQVTGITTDGLKEVTINARPPTTMFFVWVTQNGGSNGDDGSTTTAAFASYTYNVFLDSARTIQIGTAVSVEAHRDLKIAVAAGTIGWAFYDGSTLKLAWVDESRDRDSC